MAHIKIKILLFLENLETVENLKNIINKYFTEFSSYLTIDNNNILPTILPLIDFPPVKEIATVESTSELMTKFSSKESEQILLVGIFKNLIKSISTVKIVSSFIDDTGYIFVNYEPNDLLNNNEASIGFVLLNEFVNYLFFIGERGLATHAGDCIRKLNFVVPKAFSQDTDSISLSDPLLHFCSICSEKITLSLSKLVIENMETTNTISKKVVSTEKTDDTETIVQSSNPVQRATAPPPGRAQNLVDPNSDLTFDQRKLINKILKDLSILKEPLEDSEYIETRKRFFEGKISDQVFLQILKRKAKY